VVLTAADSAAPRLAVPFPSLTVDPEVAAGGLVAYALAAPDDEDEPLRM
jgi:hypothetical protein